MDEYLTAGGGKYTDAIGVHMYNAVPEDDVEAARLFRALLASHNMDKKPVWNTETGWGFDGKSSDAEVSAYVARAYILNWASHFRRYYWYSWNQTSQLGIRPDAEGRFTVLTPAASAYKQVQKWLIGARMLSCKMTAKGLWAAELLRPDGTHAQILWSVGAPQDVPLTPSGKVYQSQDLTGKVTALGNRKTVTVGAMPTLLTTCSPPKSTVLPNSHVLRQQKTFDGATAAKVRVEQFFHICLGDAAVPDRAGIYGDGRAALARCQAGGPHDFDAARPASPGVLGLKGGKQRFTAPRGAAGKRRAVRSFVHTDEEQHPAFFACFHGWLHYILNEGRTQKTV